jgi:polar amino acid transport system ATP-binding protein
MSPDVSAGSVVSAEIEIRGLSKWFGDHKVLKGVSTDVKRGEALVVIGPSGSGKTTLLRCINLLEDFQEGEIRIGGEAIGYTVDPNGKRMRRGEAEIARLRAKLGMVFQSFNLFPHMSVLRNVAFGPVRALGMPRKEAEERAAALLARVGLADKVDAMPSRLSGGQQQRVAIARAMITRPDVLFADEPTGALDSATGHNLLAYLRSTSRELGQTIVLVTHDPMAAAYADRVVLLADGRTAGELIDPDADDVLTAVRRLGA